MESEPVAAAEMAEAEEAVPEVDENKSHDEKVEDVKMNEVKKEEEEECSGAEAANTHQSGEEALAQEVKAEAADAPEETTEAKEATEATEATGTSSETAEPSSAPPPAQAVLNGELCDSEAESSHGDKGKKKQRKTKRGSASSDTDKEVVKKAKVPKKDPYSFSEEDVGCKAKKARAKAKPVKAKPARTRKKKVIESDDDSADDEDNKCDVKRECDDSDGGDGAKLEIAEDDDDEDEMKPVLSATPSPDDEDFSGAGFDDEDRLVIAEEELSDPEDDDDDEPLKAEVATPKKKPGRKKGSGSAGSGAKAAEDADDEGGAATPKRRRQNRFNGMAEEDVAKMLLPDILRPDLDILIIGINPGMYAAFKGHHYAGPGNHFWKCMFLSGLIPRPLSAEDDRRCLDYGIGFTNIVERTTKSSANLSRKEIVGGTQALLDKIKTFKPRIAVFNGKGIYEVFSGKKDFHFGRQPDVIEGTATHVWVMPNSSARCAQLPRAVDKVPFFSALKKYKDYLVGDLKEIDESEVVFSNVKLRNFNDGSGGLLKKERRGAAACESDNYESAMAEARGQPSNSGDSSSDTLSNSGEGDHVRVDPVTGKKRRGRPPKPRPDGTMPTPKRRVVDDKGNPIPRGSNPIDPLTGKKKRGRPKKCDMSPEALAAAEARRAKKSAAKREAVAVAEAGEDGENSTAGCDAAGHGTKSMGGKPTKIVTPLPPFSPNFGRVGGVEEEKPVDLKSGKMAAFDGDCGFDGRGVPDQPDQQPPQSHHAPPPPQMCSDYSTAALVGPGPGFHHPGYHYPHHLHQQQQHHQQQQPMPPQQHSAKANHHFPAAGDAASAASGPGYPPYGATASSAFSDRGAKADDLTTKSISGLESLVDQIPAMAETDSGVFSGAGSHPTTPRSVGAYSPAHAGAVPTSSQGFSPSPFQSAPSAAAFGSAYAPSTSDSLDSTNYSTSSTPSAVAAAAPSSNCTDFSVSSLVHSSASPVVSSVSGDSLFGAGPHAPPPHSDPFSVSSLTSPHDMVSRYPGLANSGPYGMFGSSPSLAGGFLGGQPSFGMGHMGPMGMSYYGQYGQPYGSGHPGFGTYSHGLHMPNPSYPYPSPYGQSPYSQSPYF